MGSILFYAFCVIKTKNILFYVLDYRNEIFYSLKFYVLFEIVLFYLNCKESIT